MQKIRKDANYLKDSPARQISRPTEVADNTEASNLERWKHVILFTFHAHYHISNLFEKITKSVMLVITRINIAHWNQHHAGLQLSKEALEIKQKNKFGLNQIPICLG